MWRLVPEGPVGKSHCLFVLGLRLACGLEPLLACLCPGQIGWEDFQRFSYVLLLLSANVGSYGQYIC